MINARLNNPSGEAGSAVLTVENVMEASLSFLGLGVKPPTASWGNILQYAQNISSLMMRPWMWMPAGILMLITVVTVNFIGDGIRDALDPKLKIQ